MAQVPLGLDAYKREYAGAPEVRLVNRFLEKDPTNLRGQPISLIARPGSDVFQGVGSAIHRGKFSQAGFLDSDLFVVAGSELWRVDVDGNAQQIAGEILGTGNVDFAHMVGPGYEYLFIADGLLLQVYTGGTHATGTLTLTPDTPPDIVAQVIKIGSVHYSWGDPTDPADGSLATPWLAALGADDEESLLNMEKMINFSGIRGTTYSDTLGGPSATVTALSTALTLVVTAKSDGTDGNAITTTVESGSDLAWGAAMLAGGGTHALSGVEVPDGVGAASVAPIASHVLVAQSFSDRMYYILPGELTIDPLNFVTAESQPDDIVNLVAAGDLVWALGESTSEAWYATGDPDVPFAPMQGRVFTRGVIEGTAVQVKDNIVLVGADMIVYSIGGGIERISHHGIEERIRTQLHRELAA